MLLLCWRWWLRFVYKSFYVLGQTMPSGVVASVCVFRFLELQFFLRLGPTCWLVAALCLINRVYCLVNWLFSWIRAVYYLFACFLNWLLRSEWYNISNITRNTVDLNANKFQIDCFYWMKCGNVLAFCGIMKMMENVMVMAVATALLIWFDFWLSAAGNLKITHFLLQTFVFLINKTGWHGIEREEERKKQFFFFD